MANWKYHISLKEPWAKADTGEISLQQLAKIIVDQLSAIAKRREDFALSEIISRFEVIADCTPDNEREDLVNEFDECMYQLYNWGDQMVNDNFNHRLCWIATF